MKHRHWDGKPVVGNEPVRIDRDADLMALPGQSAWLIIHGGITRRVPMLDAEGKPVPDPERAGAPMHVSDNLGVGELILATEAEVRRLDPRGESFVSAGTAGALRRALAAVKENAQ